jgi:hypothetical protein
MNYRISADPVDNELRQGSAATWGELGYLRALLAVPVQPLIERGPTDPVLPTHHRHIAADLLGMTQLRQPMSHLTIHQLLLHAHPISV